jgi:C4-dicarboxylate-specific signal transduction histidine kinase
LQMQTDLARAYRLVSMGEMASMLVHEIDQPLGVIANDAQACLRGMRSGQLGAAETVTALDEIASEALRTGEIVRRIRRFVSRREPQRSTVDLNELVREVVRLVASHMRQHRTALQLDLQEPLPNVHVDRVQIQQVLLNLIQNALDAMDETDGERRLMLRTWSATDTAWAGVSDTGGGIPQAEMRRIFEPYYTTKSDGVGMGLSISRSIIQLHEGALRVRANSSGGMSFEFSLPLQGSKP